MQTHAQQSFSNRPIGGGLRLLWNGGSFLFAVIVFLSLSAVVLYLSLFATD